MSYNLIEISKHDSHVFELYKITRNGFTWYYTSADEDYVYEGNTYISTPITSPDREQSLEQERNQITIRMPADLDFVRDYIGSPPTVVTTIVILNGHIGDSEILPVMTARLVNVNFTDQEAELRVESLATSLKRPCLRFNYQRNCPHDHYERGCNLNKEDYAALSAVTVTTSTVLSSAVAATKPDGYYTGGVVSWDNSGIVTNRFILDHTGSALTIELPFTGLPNGTVLTLYPGCDRTLTTCHEKFANEDNYGGQPFYPDKNPFTGDIIY